MATRNKILYLLAGFLGFVVLLGIVLSFSVPRLINSDAVKTKVNAYFLEKTGGSLGIAANRDSPVSASSCRFPAGEFLDTR